LPSRSDGAIRARPGRGVDPEICGPAPCVASVPVDPERPAGRIAEDEALQQKLRKLQDVIWPRRLRARTGVEHRSHISLPDKTQARYRGTRKNLFDLRRIGRSRNLDTTRRTKEHARTPRPDTGFNPFGALGCVCLSS